MAEPKSAARKEEVEQTLLRHARELSELRTSLSSLTEKEARVKGALDALGSRLARYCASFDRDGYKATDERLLVRALADETRIFERLGYNIDESNASFVMAVAALLDGRNQTALDGFEQLLERGAASAPLRRNAHYLCGMISYNRQEYSRATRHFQACADGSPEDGRDWQARIYVAELAFFMRRNSSELDKSFADIEEGLKRETPSTATSILLAMLHLKWGNVHVGTISLEPREQNPSIDNGEAVRLFKTARQALPRHVGNDSLLTVVINYSLAQALLLTGSIDMDLDQTPAELLDDVFQNLRQIVLAKREELILAQCYFMLGTCCVYSDLIPNELGELYLEYARSQTLTLPSDVCLYSCVTKELLARAEFVRQIDFFAKQLRINSRRF
jgi:tetratricopeptide (TPR) repeat protein